MANATRVFALIIGIDRYRSGSIWDLHSCVDDAENVRNWLTNALEVPKTHIRTLLDDKATKQSIEDAFMDHLVNNPSIQQGDAIIIYFAGHGSFITAPHDWYGGEVMSPTNVPVLCPYDHDTKKDKGRISGISDRSLLALLNDLAVSKGNNITLILDACFKPPKSQASNRRFTRHTETRANGDDLYRDMWVTARGRPCLKGGLFKPSSSFILLAASPMGGPAVEDKEGGKFTSTLLHAVSDLTLHRTSYSSLLDRMLQLVGGLQKFVCIGSNKDRTLFDDIPFTPDTRYFPATMYHSRNVLHVDMGSIHGIVQGTEFTVHLHNRSHSINPALASAIVVDVEGSSSIAQARASGFDIPKVCWVRVSRWNNQPPFCVKLRTTLTSFFRSWGLRKRLPRKGADPAFGAFNITRVRKSEEADISVTVHRERVEVRQRSLPRGESEVIPVVNIPSRSAADVIGSAARFQLHLLQQNPEKPLEGLVQMQLYRLHPASWTRQTRNLLSEKNAVIPYRPGDIYQLSLQNLSSIDLWPYVVFMDPTSYRNIVLYQPDQQCKTPPLCAGGRLDIGSDESAPQALSFTLADSKPYNSAFLKLFLSSKPVTMEHLKDGSESTQPVTATTPNPAEMDTLNRLESSKASKHHPHIWNADLAVITFSPPASGALGSARG